MKVESADIRVYKQADGRYVAYAEVVRERDLHTDVVEKRSVESSPHKELQQAVAEVVQMSELLRP